MLPFRRLSVCLSVVFVHCAQTAEDIDRIFCILYNSPMWPCVSQIALKFALHRSPRFSPILPQSDPPPVDLSVGGKMDGKLRPNGQIWRSGHNGEPI